MYIHPIYISQIASDGEKAYASLSWCDDELKHAEKYLSKTCGVTWSRQMSIEVAARAPVQDTLATPTSMQTYICTIVEVKCRTSGKSSKATVRSLCV